MLDQLAAKYADTAWVLVTADDRMPFEHSEDVQRLAATIATIDGRWAEGGYPDQETWKRETVHRWAHFMAEQKQITIRRYSPKGHRVWTPLRKWL